VAQQQSMQRRFSQSGDPASVDFFTAAQAAGGVGNLAEMKGSMRGLAAGAMGMGMGMGNASGDDGSAISKSAISKRTGAGKVRVGI
jgi:hypothetical protein